MTFKDRPARLLISDKDPFACEALREALSGPNIEIAGVALDGKNTMEMADACDPDCVILDIDMPDTAGLEVLSELKRRHPSMHVVIITASDRPHQVAGALARGASGYLTKRDINIDELPSVIKKILSGSDAFVDGGALRGMLRSSVLDLQLKAPFHEIRTGAFQALSSQEYGVLRLLSRHWPDSEIARELVLSTQTVKGHIQKILNKLELEDREQLERLVGQ